MSPGSKVGEFFAELRRRRVYNAAIAYVVVGLGVLGAAELILDPLGLTGLRPAIVVLTILGLPLALVLAWAYELGPSGPTRDRGGAAPSLDGTQSIATASGEAETDSAHLGDPSPDDRASVAVLPFANMSAVAENEYFSAGVADDILTHLSRVRALRVTSRTSVAQYKDTMKPIPEIARELRVSSVLEGSIRVVGDRVRVTVQLIDARTDAHLWAETYDRDLDDVFAVQSEVAESVAKALSAELSSGEKEQIHARQTGNVEAYSLCLRAEEALYTWAPKDLELSARLFEEALRLDPNYARAHAGRAMTLLVTPALSTRRPPRLHERAAESTARALELDPQLALAHVARSMLLWNRDYDWTGAEDAMARAVELEPTDPLVRGPQAILLILQTRFDEAIAALERVEDKTSTQRYVPQLMKSQAYRYSGRISEAMGCVKEPLRLYPDRFNPHWEMAQALMAEERWEAALEEFDEAIAADPEIPLGVAGRAVCLAGLHRHDETKEAIARLENWEGPESVGPFAMGYAYLAGGRVEDALDQWEEAVRQRDLFTPYARLSAQLRPLRAHPRFQAILQSMWPEHGPFEMDQTPRTTPSSA